MELLSNSLRELQERNDLLSNENRILKSKMNLINEMNETLIGIKNHLENTIKIISIQINSIDSMIPTNIDNELKKLRNNYERLKLSLNQNERQIASITACDQQMVNNNNNIIISNITGNSNSNTIHSNLDNNQNTHNIKSNVMENTLQVIERVENVSQSIAYNQQNSREESNLSIIEEREHLLMEIPLPQIKTELEFREFETQFVCEQPNCGLKFSNAFRLSVHRRTHLARQQMRHKCPNKKCNFMTNKKSNYTKHLTICQKIIFKCDFLGCDEFFTKILELKRHKKTCHTTNKSQTTQIPLNENVNNSNITNNQIKEKREGRPLLNKRPTKYRKAQKNNKIKRNIYGNYECYYQNCDRVFCEKIRLVYHLRTHTDERPHKCHFDGCDKGFKTPGQLKNHINVHTGSKPYKCDGISCGQVCEYATLSQLHHHKKRYHSGIKPFKCDFELFDCKACFVSIREMRAHKNIVHYNKRPKTVSEISVHQNVNQLNRINRLHMSNRAVSNIVNKTTAVTNLEKEIDLTPIQIPPIELSSPVIELSPLNLTEEQNQSITSVSLTNNSEKLLFSCDYFGCDKAFKTAVDLVRHNTEHSQIVPNVTMNESTPTTTRISHACTPNTSINTSFNASLNTPLYNSLNKTLNKSNYSIRESSLSSIDSNSSRSETRRVTTAAKGPYVCVECNQEFEQQSQYLIHIQKHAKPFQCLFDGCGKSFKNKEQLRVHIRVHTGEKPFVCNYVECGKGFKTSCQLSQHMIIHTGLKLYKCEVFECQRDFATQSQLIHHRKRYHSELIQK